MSAEVLAKELGLPLYIARIEGIISSFLGETAANIRKLFDGANRYPCVFFLDEFDALARARVVQDEHNELRRVVNSLLMMIDRYKGRGLLIAATNLQKSLDSAIWRRFDDIIFFDLPDAAEIREFLVIKTRNYLPGFDIKKKAPNLRGLSYADIERICQGAIKRSILKGLTRISESDFNVAIRDERRRQSVHARLKDKI
jgi:SpoVK/Ycf46/Vps4 family AAA+-type ATPase